MAIPYPPEYTFHELEMFTDSFSQENFIGRTQFGKLYHGKMIQQDHSCRARDVTVKIWCLSKLYNTMSSDTINEYHMIDEFTVLQKLISKNPNLVKLIGYCSEGDHIGLVYDFKTMDTLHNLIPKDNFEWLDRMKVAFELACLIEFLNGWSFFILIRNLDAAHIMLDQDYNPKLLDLSMVSGGPIRLKTKYPKLEREYGCYGYIDPNFATTGKWSDKCDVFAFGVILLSLISKRVFERGEDNISDEPFVYEWAKNEYKEQKKSMWGFLRPNCSSLVHQSLKDSPEYSHRDGHEITKIAMKCVEFYPSNRPTMEEVVKSLLSVGIVKQHAYFLGDPPIRLWS